MEEYVKSKKMPLIENLLYLGLVLLDAAAFIWMCHELNVNKGDTPTHMYMIMRISIVMIFIVSFVSLISIGKCMIQSVKKYEDGIILYLKDTFRLRKKGRKTINTYYYIRNVKSVKKTLFSIVISCEALRLVEEKKKDTVIKGFANPYLEENIIASPKTKKCKKTIRLKRAYLDEDKLIKDLMSLSKS